MGASKIRKMDEVPLSVLREIAQDYSYAEIVQALAHLAKMDELEEGEEVDIRAAGLNCFQEQAKLLKKISVDLKSIEDYWT